ncbi:MAG: AMP-binding protein [Acutalibacteraceae bacterium]|nr:AMP-binding protein [Acutalibacteraceae bacterium]
MSYGNSHETLRGMLIESAEKYADRDAFLLNTGQGVFPVKYKKFKSDADALATALLGILNLKNKKIAICAKNSYEWCLSYMAVLSGVGVVVPTDKELSAEELSNILNMGGIDAVICDNRSAKKILSVIHSIEKKPILIGCEEREKDSLIPLKFLLQRGYELLAQGYTLPSCEQINSDELAVLLFTSGTTGVSKGVMLSNRNLYSDLKAVTHSVEVNENDVSLSVLPLHHTYEAIAFLMMIYKGGCISFSKGFRYLVYDFAQYKPTVFVSVPLILEKIHRRITEKTQEEGKQKKIKLLSLVSAALNDDKRKKIFEEVHALFGGRLRKIIVGAASLKKNVAEDFELFGIPVIIGYGLTECSPIVICNSDNDRTTDSVGKPVTGVEVKIENKDENGIGEIHVKGPMVMKGYYKNEDETQRVLKNGWFNTGDLGYIDKSGNYHLTGRSKNIIVTSTGKNIYPEELELMLYRNPTVRECIVYSKQDNVITAEILPDYDKIKLKLKKDTPTENDVLDILCEAIRSTNKKLPAYKRINRFVLRETEFSKTTTHKIKRG